MSILSRIAVDKFLLAILITVLLATIWPCEGEVKQLFKQLTNFAIALLFFMHGAKLSRQAILKGMGHWRLHLAVFVSTFLLFPLLGIAMQWLVPSVLTQELYWGFLFLCAMPGTVQSAIAFTSVAGGNVPAAICSASASSLLGVFLSPLLVGLLMQTQGESHNTLGAIQAIVLQLMVPFVVGHLVRPWLGKWIDAHKNSVNKVDRSSILLVVYTAFSEAVIGGIWHQVTISSLIAIVICSLLLLLCVMSCNVWMAKTLHFRRADKITLLFCGSKKSLVNGIPMANILFPAATVGILVLPLMIFHQLQLIVCAVLAQWFASKNDQKE